MRIRTGLATVAAVAALSACGSGSLPLLPSAGGGAAGAAEDDRSSAMSSMPYFSVRYRLAPDFKDDLPDKAKAYELESETTGAAVAKLAKAFGVSGKVTSSPDEWTVAERDLTLHVAKRGGLPFSFGGDQAVSSGSGCAEPAAPDAAPDAPADAPRCPEPATNPDLPTKPAAEKIALDALRAAGLDLDGAKVTVDGGYESWNVSVAHKVGSTTTHDIASSVLVGPKGRIIAAFGMLAQPEALGDYPLVTAADAVDRLNEMQAGGASDGREPAVGAPEPDIASDQPNCEDPAVSCVPGWQPHPNAAEPQVREVVLTRATTTLMTVGGYEPNSALHLVPAFRFTSEDGGEVQVEAATDEHIQPPAKDLPADAPKPADPDPGSGGGSGDELGDDSCVLAPMKFTDGNEDLILEVCASDIKVAVGQEITFRVTAKDADGSFVNGPCEAPVAARFGDEGDGGETATCMACAQATEGKHEHFEKLSHTYGKPGTFKAMFTAHSGSTCDPRPGDSKAAVTLTIEVIG